MGILGYPNMGDDNRDGVFGDYSDIYSNFSNEENNTSGEETEAFAQTSYDEVNNNIKNQHGNGQEGVNVASYAKKENSKLFLFVIALILVFLSAVGMFVYKKQTTVQSSQEMMGDYFYNQVTATQPETQKVENNTETTEINTTETKTEDVATIDVDLTTPDSSIAQPVKNEKSSIKKEEKVVQKTQTALEKAMQKKKADEDKENIISLNKSVLIPVTSGGRPDPFVPYNQTFVTKSTSPSFDLVAPPLAIPESDPKTDKIFEFRLTGIMYDNVRPSAILVIDETQQLVHKGDIVMGYKILDITRKSVIVQYKTNTYEVCAGQSIEQGLNLNPVSTLSQQFGGAYTKPDANVIQFNN